MQGVLSEQILAGVGQVLGRLHVVLQPKGSSVAAGGGASDADVAQLAERLQGVLGAAGGGVGKEAVVVSEMPSVSRCAHTAKQDGR